MSTGRPAGRSASGRGRLVRAGRPTINASPAGHGEPTPAADVRMLPRTPAAAGGSMRRAPFAALVVLVLGVGLIGQLLLNTSLSQGAFGLQELRAESSDLAETQQTLQQELARLQSPQQLASKAQALGMVPSKNPVFLDLTDGRIDGVPVAATAPPPPPTTAPPTTPPGAPAGTPATANPGQSGATLPTTPPATGAAR